MQLDISTFMERPWTCHSAGRAPHHHRNGSLMDGLHAAVPGYAAVLPVLQKGEVWLAMPYKPAFPGIIPADETQRVQSRAVRRSGFTATGPFARGRFRPLRVIARDSRRWPHKSSLTEASMAITPSPTLRTANLWAKASRGESVGSSEKGKAMPDMSACRRDRGVRKVDSDHSMTVTTGPTGSSADTAAPTTARAAGVSGAVLSAAGKTSRGVATTTSDSFFCWLPLPRNTSPVSQQAVLSTRDTYLV